MPDEYDDSNCSGSVTKQLVTVFHLFSGEESDWDYTYANVSGRARLNEYGDPSRFRDGSSFRTPDTSMLTFQYQVLADAPVGHDEVVNAVVDSVVDWRRDRNIFRGRDDISVYASIRCVNAEIYAVDIHYEFSGGAYPVMWEHTRTVDLRSEPTHRVTAYRTYLEAHPEWLINYYLDNDPKAREHLEDTYMGGRAVLHGFDHGRTYSREYVDEYGGDAYQIIDRLVADVNLGAETLTGGERVLGVIAKLNVGYRLHQYPPQKLFIPLSVLDRLM